MTDQSFHRPVIAVTGSAGKSTTKEMLAAILRRQWKILKTYDNYNGTFYTNRHLKEFQDPSYQAAVLEYGLIEPGAILRHCQIMPPDIAAITSIGSAHLAHYGGDIKQLAKGKSEIIQGMNPQGLLILNADDAGYKLIDRHGFTGKILTVGVNQAADYQGFDIRFAKEGMTFQVKLQGKAQTLYIPILGRHHIYNALIAVAIADQLGFRYYDIWQGLKKYTRPLRRLQITQLRDNMTLIDDSYSANPHAAKASLDVLSEVGKGRRIAVLGDMLELGSYTDQGHQEVGEHLAEKRIDYLLTYGDLGKQIANAAIAKGFPASHVFTFAQDERDALHLQISKLMQQNTTLLLKGSNGMKLWQTAEHIKTTFAK